jgi:hypothetical protein
MPELFTPPLLDARHGANRYVWDLRLQDARLVDDAVLWGAARGPLVPPGTYQARLSRGEWSETVSFQVVADPRCDTTQEEIEARFRLASAISGQLNRAHDAIRTIRSVRSQARDQAVRIDDPSVTEAVDQLAGDLTAIEEQLHQTRSSSSQDVLNFPPQLDNQLLYLLGNVESAKGQPTASSRERFDQLEAELDSLVAELDQLLEERLPELEELLSGKPRIVIEDRDE